MSRCGYERSTTHCCLFWMNSCWETPWASLALTVRSQTENHLFLLERSSFKPILGAWSVLVQTCSLRFQTRHICVFCLAEYTPTCTVSWHDLAESTLWDASGLLMIDPTDLKLEEAGSHWLPDSGKTYVGHHRTLYVYIYMHDYIYIYICIGIHIYIYTGLYIYI